MLHGRHAIRAWSKEQPTIATSSGEAELYACNLGAQQGLGLQSLAADLGLKAHLSVEVDSSAAEGIIRRRGLGKTRHISVHDLWLQDKVRNKELALMKIPGTANSADLGTKPVTADVLQKHMQRIGYY